MINQGPGNNCKETETPSLDRNELKIKSSDYSSIITE